MFISRKSKIRNEFLKISKQILKYSNCNFRGVNKIVINVELANMNSGDCKYGLEVCAKEIKKYANREILIKMNSSNINYEKDTSPRIIKFNYKIYSYIGKI